jgi:hypothetical protein
MDFVSKPAMFLLPTTSFIHHLRLPSMRHFNEPYLRRADDGCLAFDRQVCLDGRQAICNCKCGSYHMLKQCSPSQCLRSERDRGSRPAQG